MPSDPVLAVVVPVYNEADRLPILLKDWMAVFQAIAEPYTIFLIDDGSRDNSLDIAKALDDPHLSIHSQANAGHGPAILKGYHLAKNAEWVFQIDSDHQLDPAAFQLLWDNRSQYDLLLGQREERHAAFSRRLLSFVSATMVRTLYGPGVKDVNCPYRLMRGSLLQQALRYIPARSFAPNILLTGWFIHKKCRIFTTVVQHRNTDRRPSRMSGYILRGAFRSLGQTFLFRLGGRKRQ